MPSIDEIQDKQRREKALKKKKKKNKNKTPYEKINTDDWSTTDPVQGPGTN